MASPTTAQIISPIDINTIIASNFNAKNPTRIFVHGWKPKAKGRAPSKFADAYLLHGKHNVNFIAVDWYEGARSKNYLVVRRRVNLIGPYVARLINVLVEKMHMKLSAVHIIGHSLGAHIAGIAGKHITGGGKVGKIVGLDPAKPLFDYHSHALRLHHNDADYVESIHSNAGRLGFREPIGHASFYPNGGRNQPGCAWDRTGTCSHSRSIELFIESLYSKLEFYGFGCESIESLEVGRCRVVNEGAIMGREPGNLGKVSGIYLVKTNSHSPYARGRPPTLQ